MLDLLKLQPDEAERLAYAEGFPMAAELFARIDRLQCAANTLIGLLNVHAGDLDPLIVEAVEVLQDEANP